MTLTVQSSVHYISALFSPCYVICQLQCSFQTTPFIEQNTLYKKNKDSLFTVPLRMHTNADWFAKCSADSLSG